MVNEERESMETAIYTHDEKGKRIDVHAPSVINPGDYQYVGVDMARKALKEGQKIAGPGGVCHHCGKAIVWRVHFKHLPTNNIVTFGYICTEILEMSNDRIEHEMVLLKRRAANERVEEMKKREHRDRFDSFVRNYPEEYDFILKHADENSYIARLKWGIDTFGSPLDHHIAGLQRFIAGHKKMIANQIQEAQEQINMPELVAGRRLLKGTIISHKYQESPSFGTVHKMLVKLEDGNKVFGTMPQSIEDAHYSPASGSVDPVGSKVEFVAKVEPKEDHFGFFARPSNGRVV